MTAVDEGDADGSTRLAYILGVPLAEDVLREWPQMGEVVRGRDLIAAVEGNFEELTLAVGKRRRFDDVLELPGPTPEQASELLGRLMRQWNATPDPATLQATTGLSFADIHAAVDDARKETILDGRNTPNQGEAIAGNLNRDHCGKPGDSVVGGGGAQMKRLIAVSPSSKHPSVPHEIRVRIRV